MDTINEISENEHLCYFHPINFLDHIRKVAPGYTDTLKMVQDRVMKIPCLQPPKDGVQNLGIYGYRNNTFCNHAVFLTILATDENYTNFTNGKRAPPDSVDNITNVPANGIGRPTGENPYRESNIWYDVLVNQSLHYQTSGIIEVNGKDAQHLANRGYTVIGAWKNLNNRFTDLTASPHYVTVRPSNDEYNETKGPKVANVGSEIDVDNANEFYGPTLPEVRWFFNIKQKHCLNLNLISVLEARDT
jgi:hypothetical protein